MPCILCLPWPVPGGARRSCPPLSGAARGLPGLRNKGWHRGGAGKDLVGSILAFHSSLLCPSEIILTLRWEPTNRRACLTLRRRAPGGKRNRNGALKRLQIKAALRGGAPQGPRRPAGRSSEPGPGPLTRERGSRGGLGFRGQLRRTLRVTTETAPV